MTIDARIPLLIVLSCAVAAACTLTPVPKPVPVPGATCQQACEHYHDVLRCGGPNAHEIDAIVCRVDCEDRRAIDPECVAGADSCASAELCQ